MDKINQDYFQEQNSWFDCIGDFQQKIKQKKDRKIVKFETQFLDNDKSMPQFLETETSKNNRFIQESKVDNSRVLKREREKPQKDYEFYTQNSSSNDIASKNSDGKDDFDKQARTNKEEKQHIYSKNYRARKKEHIKLVEEQNYFLKNKIKELQFKLREMELQINRLKYMPQQKQFTIQQLNEEFLQKVTIIMEKNKDNPAQYKDKYDSSDPFYSEFMQTYSKHGFGGSKKTQIMNYYFNQIIESMLRDSQKYFAIICYETKDPKDIKGLSQYESINSVFWEILQPDEDKLKRLDYFKINLHPLVSEFVDACKQFYAKYNKILRIIDRIHVFMKTTYPSNFDFARKRIIDLESWFQQYKYSKMMRNLQKQWIQLIKTEQTQTQKKTNTGTKKRK